MWQQPDKHCLGRHVLTALHEAAKTHYTRLGSGVSREAALKLKFLHHSVRPCSKPSLKYIFVPWEMRFGDVPTKSWL